MPKVPTGWPPAFARLADNNLPQSPPRFVRAERASVAAYKQMPGMMAFGCSVTAASPAGSDFIALVRVGEHCARANQRCPPVYAADIAAVITSSPVDVERAKGDRDSVGPVPCADRVRRAG